MKQTKEEYEKAFKTLNSLLIHNPFKDDHRDYNDSFKAFKLLSDTTLRAFNKDSLIGYIHTLYCNWQVSDSFYENTVKENMKLLEDKSRLLNDIHDYRYENHCMKLTIRNLCNHFGVENEEELQKIYLKDGEK